MTQPAAVETVQTTLAELDLDLFIDHWISASTANPTEAGEPYTLSLHGFVLGRQQRVKVIDLMDANATDFPEGLPIRSIRVASPRKDIAAAYPDVSHARICGIDANISSLAFPPSFNVNARAILEDGTMAKIASMQGQRARLRSSFVPTLQPLLVTTLGRSGSTLLMSLLETHPQIAVHNPRATEPRVASYWASVLTALAEPAAYLRQIAPHDSLNGQWWLGQGAPGYAFDEDQWAAQWIGSDGVEALAGFCQGRIDNFYREVALRSEKLQPTHFAEKYQPGTGNPAPSLSNPAPMLLSEIYPGFREVIIVRDFRDMVCSMLAFTKRVGPVFGRRPDLSDEQFTRSWEKPVMALLNDWRARGDSALLMRYEDLIRAPAESISALLNYIGVDSGDPLIEVMTSQLHERPSEHEVHRTSPDAEKSIGRWRRDLDPALQELCEEIFGPALEAFGYADVG